MNAKHHFWLGTACGFVFGVAFSCFSIYAHADDLPPLPDRPGARTILVRATSPYLHGAPSWYQDSTDTIFVNRDHPNSDCLAILENHEKIHRQQFYRGEDIHTARAEREAREGSMSRSCTDAGRAPVFPALADGAMQ